MKRILIILLLLAAVGQAANYTITSLPYSATNYDTLFIDGTRLNSTTNGIDFNTGDHDIVLYLGTDTVAFAVSDSATGSSAIVNDNSNTYGLNLAGSCYNIKIVGGVIMSDPTGANSTYLTCMRQGSAHDITFEGTKFVIKNGYNSHCIAGSGTVYNITFNDCKFEDKVTGYTSRCAFDGVAVQLSSYTFGSQGAQDGYYHFKFDGCKIDTANGGAFHCLGMKLYLENCTTYVDTRNDFYTYPEDNYCHGTTNNGHCTATLLKAGSYIKNNHMVSQFYQNKGTDIGILVECALGTEVNPVLVCSNYVDVKAGQDAHYGYMNSKALKTRYGNDYLHVFDNTFIARVGDGYPNCETYNILTGSYNSDWPEYGGDEPDSNMTIERNKFYAFADDDQGSACRGVNCAVGAGVSGVTWAGCNIVWQNNYVWSAGNIYEMSGYDGSGHDIRFMGDTVSFDTISTGTRYTFKVGYYLNSTGNIARNIHYTGGATDTSILFGGSYAANIAIQRTYYIYVLDTLGNPIENAIVRVIDNYGHSFYDTTNAQGLAQLTLNTWFEAYNTTDSTAYNPFDIWAKLGTDSTLLENQVLSCSVYTDTVVLTQSEGSSAAEISLDIAATDTTNTSVTIEIDATLINNANIDSLIICCSSGDTIIVVDPADPFDSLFSGLESDSSFDFWAIAFDLDSGITEYSETLSVSTLGSDKTINQSPACTDITHHSLTFYDTTSVQNTTIDTLIFYLSVDTFSTIIDSAIYENPITLRWHQFNCLLPDTNYQLYVKAWNTGDDVTDYSETLYVNTYAEPDGFDNTGWTLLYHETFDTTFEGEDGQAYGDSGWLILQLLDGGEINFEGCYAEINTPNFQEAAMFRSIDTLPNKFMLRVKVGYIEYDLGNYEQEDYDDPDFEAHDGYYENGAYIFTLADDTCSGDSCAEDWWHYHRKLVIDFDNHVDYAETTTTNHPIFFVYLDSATNASGNLLRTWDTLNVEWDSTEWNWNVGYVYEYDTWYWAELIVTDEYALMTFYDEEENILVGPDTIAIELINAYNTASYLYIGEPHTDDYEGSYRVDEISFFTPTETGTRPDTLQGECFHSSILAGLMYCDYPYDNCFKWRVDSVATAYGWPMLNKLWDYRQNTACGESWGGDRSWSYAEVYGEYNGYMIGDPYHDWAKASGCISTENFDNNFNFFRYIFYTSYCARDTAYAWGKMMLPHWRYDTDLDPDSQLVDLDYMIIGLTPFWADGAGTLRADYKAQLEEAVDSIALYPEKVFMLFFDSPDGVAYLDSADKVDNMQFVVWAEDTLIKPDNFLVEAGPYWGMIETNPDSANYGGYKTDYSSDDTHPSGVAPAIGQDSCMTMFARLFDYLYGYYEDEEEPDTSISQIFVISDTTSGSLEFNINYTISNCPIDSVILKANGISNKDTNPDDPHIYEFTGLTAETEYTCIATTYADCDILADTLIVMTEEEPPPATVKYIMHLKGD